MKKKLHLLIVECDPPEKALDFLRGAGETAAQAFEFALRGAALSVQITHAEPWFSDFDPGAIDPARFDGAILTGWAALSEITGERPDTALAERLMSAGVPLFGSGRGFLISASLLGASFAQGPEAGIRRGLMRGEERFDAFASGGAVLAEAPSGAKVITVDAAGVPQAIATAGFRGCRYQPEATLRTLAHWLGKSSPRMAREIGMIAAEPVAHARLLAKHRIGLDLLDPASRMKEVSAWLESLGNETRLPASPE